MVTCAVTHAQSEEENWSFIVTNVGGTGFAIGGTTTAGQQTLSLGPASVNHPAVPCSSNWYLQIEVSFRSRVKIR